jgi:putative glutamine amidotransferase
MQLLNVLRGGTLIQHIPDAMPHALAHTQCTPKNTPAHPIAVTPDSLLHRCIGRAVVEVNSTHHQAVEQLGEGLHVSATAPDGVIEAIEDPAYPFCLGVQWHPEYGVTSHEQGLWVGFAAACRGYQRKNTA